MTSPRPRPVILTCNTTCLSTGCGHIYITINCGNNGMFEVFAHLGKSGPCASAQLEALCRSITAGLRAGVAPEVFVKQLSGIQCAMPAWDSGVQIKSCADALSRAIASALKE